MSAFIPPLAAHLWSSTLFLAAALLLGALLRNRLTASGRFALALTGIVKFAIPSAIVAPLFRARAAAVPLTTPMRLLRGALQPDVAPPRAAVWPAVVLAIWAAVAVALIIRSMLLRRRLLALAVRTAQPPHPRESEALARARRRIGVRRSVDLVRAEVPAAPAVLRIVHPMVILPPNGCDDLSDEELESLLRHECAHVARHDNLIARIESVIAALFWFHPLLWIAQRITSAERERACDEMVGASAEERETYLAALAKFCHAAIAPRLPGVSCMATGKLKERMEYVMSYESLQSRVVAPKRVALFAAIALVAFTAALAAGVKGDAPYAIRIEVQGDEPGYVVVHATITDNATHAVVAEPRVKFALDTTASITNDHGFGVQLKARSAGDQIAVDVTIERDRQVLQTATLYAAPSSKQFTGDPISIDLRDADLRDVIAIFGKLTGMNMRFEAPVDGKVTVNWRNVPWDQAFDSLLNDHGLAYRIEGKTIVITNR